VDGVSAGIMRNRLLVLTLYGWRAAPAPLLAPAPGPPSSRLEPDVCALGAASSALWSRLYAGTPGVDSHLSEAARLKAITKEGVAAPPFASPPSLLVAAPLQNLKRSIAPKTLHDFPPWRYKRFDIPFMERNTNQPPHN
jgi:hypothetical protein